VRTSIIHSLPKPFTLPQIENALTKRNAFPHGVNPTREAEKLLRLWLKQGRVRVSFSKGLPRYWPVRGEA